MIFYLNRSFGFEKYFIFFVDTITQKRKGNFGQVLGNIKRCSDRNIYQILQQAQIRQTIKSSLKLSKHSQVQPLHYSASAFQNSYNSTVKLRSTVFLEIFYISMLITCVTQTLRNFLHFNVKDMRPVSSNSSFP